MYIKSNYIMNLLLFKTVKKLKATVWTSLSWSGVFGYAEETES